MVKRMELELLGKVRKAQKILGENIISPLEVNNILKEKTSVEKNLYSSIIQNYVLLETIPEDSELNRLNEEGYLMIPRPPENCFRVLEDFIRIEPDLFLINSDIRISLLEINKEKIKGSGWIFFKKDVLGRNLSYKEQLELIQSSNGYLKRLPTVTELSWIFLIYYLSKGKVIFDKRYYIRTSSFMNNNHLILGLSNGKLINVIDFSDYLKSMMVGISPISIKNL